MAEQGLAERLRAKLEHVDDLGAYSLVTELAKVIERELADHDRRLEQLEGPVLHGRTIVAHATKEAIP